MSDVWKTCKRSACFFLGAESSTAHRSKLEREKDGSRSTIQSKQLHGRVDLLPRMVPGRKGKAHMGSEWTWQELAVGGEGLARKPLT